MRQTLLLILVTGFCFCAQSQVVNKGDKLFGGSFSASFGSSSQQNTASNAGIYPSFAWATRTNRVFGIKGSVFYTTDKNGTPQGDQKSHTIWVGPGIFLKQYKLLKDKFGVFFNNELNGSYSLQKQDYYPNSYTNERWGVNYNFNPGVFYKFSDNFLGEASIGGAYVNYAGGESFHSFNIGASFLQTFNLGVNFIIRHKAS